VDGEGRKRVVGAWDGHTADRSLARAVVQGPLARGLEAQQGLVASPVSASYRRAPVASGDRP